MREKLMVLILKCLLKVDGLPMPESGLLTWVALAARPAEPTDADVRSALREVEARQWAIGLTDDLTGRSWTLTTDGKHKAIKL